MRVDWPDAVASRARDGGSAALVASAHEHWPFTQRNPLTQPASEVQLIPQAPLVQVYGAQDRKAGETQVPVPSQAGAGVKVLPEHVALPHVLPAGRAVQVPVEPVAVQVTHAPVQAVLQQTPPVQNPLAHPEPLLQAVPLAAPCRWAAQRIAASVRALPAVVSTVAVVSLRKKATRRSGAARPTIEAPFS